jgi:hypothetical protein
MGNEQRYDRADLCDRVTPSEDITLRILDLGVGTQIMGVRCSHRRPDHGCEDPTNNSKGFCKYAAINF